MEIQKNDYATRYLLWRTYDRPPDNLLVELDVDPEGVEAGAVGVGEVVENTDTAGLPLNALVIPVTVDVNMLIRPTMIEEKVFVIVPIINSGPRRTSAMTTMIAMTMRAMNDVSNPLVLDADASTVIACARALTAEVKAVCDCVQLATEFCADAIVIEI